VALVGYRTRDLVRVPGLLSLSRLPLAVAFPLLFKRPACAVALLAAAAASDVLDGWYARVSRQETPTGAVLDGAMDKLFMLSVLSTLVVTGSLSWAAAIVLSVRELGELPLATRVLLRPAGALGPRANAFGKAATVLQFATVALVTLGVGPREVLVGLTGTSGALSVAEYWRRAVHDARPARGQAARARSAHEPTTHG